MQRLKNDPNAVDVCSVKEQVHGADDALLALLRKILGEELFRIVCNNKPPVPIPPAAIETETELARKLSQCRTVIYLWGVGECGKSSVVGSLLALPGVTVDAKLNSYAMHRRARALAENFAPCPDSYKALRQTKEHNEAKLTFATIHYRKGRMVRSYKVAFVEADVVQPLPVRLLNAPTEQIHLFCLDPTESIEPQTDHLTNRLNELEAAHYIERQTVGVNVVVTKVDTLYRVPRDYRHGAAQTMVTVRCRRLWQQIRNICYSKGIYGATPIAFSIGDVRLKSLARLTPDSSRQLLLAHLMPKCRPEPTLLQRIMSWGGRWATAVLSVLILAAMGYGLYCSFHIDSPAPPVGNVCYKFMPDFCKRVGLLAEARDFSIASQLYDELESDLVTEHSVYFFTSTGEQRLIPTDSFKLCRQKLDSTMASIVCRRADRELKSSAWDEAFLASCVGYADRLKGRDHLARTVRQELTTAAGHIHTYFEIRRMAQHPACASVDDVTSSIHRMESYRKQPYTNSHEVCRQLNDFPEVAVRSCADKFSLDADSLAEIRYSLRQRSYGEYFRDFVTGSRREQHNLEDIRLLRSNLLELKRVAHSHEVFSSDSTIDAALIRLRV